MDIPQTYVALYIEIRVLLPRDSHLRILAELRLNYAHTDMGSQEEALRQLSEAKPGSARALFAIDGEGGGPPMHDTEKHGLKAPQDCLSSSNGVHDGAQEGEESCSTPKRTATARRLFEGCSVSEIERYLQAAEAQVSTILRTPLTIAGQNHWRPMHCRRTHPCVSGSVITSMDIVAQPWHL